jgi:hypothetical protein
MVGGKVAIVLIFSGCLAHRGVANTAGQAVTIGTARDNSAIKISYGSYSSVSSAAPVGLYAVSYITPDANWATTGAVDITFQMFNPGGLNSGSIPKITQGIGYNLVSTAVAGLQYTSTTSAAVASVAVPTVGTLTATVTASGFGNFPTGGSIPSASTYNYLAATGSTVTAPTSPATGGGDIITWILTPNAGKKIYVSDFYNSQTTDGLGLYSVIHLQGVNGSSSVIGATAPNIVYVVPEPGTWAAGAGVLAILGSQAYSRRRRHSPSDK